MFFLQLSLLWWIKAFLCILDPESQQSSMARCAWSSWMLWSGQEHASSVELHRPLLCSLWSSYFCGFLLFYTGAFTTLTCRMWLFPQRFTTTTGMPVNSPAPAKQTLQILLYLSVQVRLWVTCIFLVLLSTGQCVSDKEQEACMCVTCVVHAVFIQACN